MSEQYVASGDELATDREDRALLLAVQDGDARAFERLVTRYTRSAYTVAFRILRNREDAEDAVQETFMRMLHNVSSFDAARPFRPWFFRIVRNQAINTQRSTRVRETDEIPAETASRAAGADALAERDEWSRSFASAIATLTTTQRAIVELHDVEGFSSTEIGTKLGIPAPTVRWHLQQARRILRAALQLFAPRAAHS